MDGVMRRREMVQSKRLPSGYTEVEYINCTASQQSTQAYVNMVTVVDNPTIANAYIDFQEASSASQTTTYVFGMRQKGSTAQQNYFGWGIRLSNHTTINSWSANPGASYVASESFTRHKVTATWKANELTIQEEGGQVYTSTQTTRPIGQYPICLFGVKHVTQPASGTPYPLKGKIYSAKVWQDGTLIMDAVPCIRDSDNKPGFYDLVANEFRVPYGNYFSAGSPV